MQRRLTWTTLALCIFLPWHGSAQSQDKKLADKPSTLEELKGEWIVDLDKLADTEYYKRYPKFLEKHKKWLALETITIDAKKSSSRILKS